MRTVAAAILMLALIAALLVTEYAFAEELDAHEPESSAAVTHSAIPNEEQGEEQARGSNHIANLPGRSHQAPPDETIKFAVGIIGSQEAGIVSPTTMAFGPDGCLYVGQMDGSIISLKLEDRAVVATERIASDETFGAVLGIAFNPAGPADPLTIYASHSELYGYLDGPSYPGMISMLAVPGFQPVPVISGLPLNGEHHANNGIAFDSNGRLYIAQGCTTNLGIPSKLYPRPETPLSGAILVADLGDPAFDGAVQYDPPDAPSDDTDQIAGDVSVFASGFRNPYDLVFHSNGYLYATENGPNGAAGEASLSCDTQGPGVDDSDELNLVVKGAYYGHPNRNRGRLNPVECTFHHASDDSPGHSSPIATLGTFVVPVGIAEYTADAFDGRLRGNLIYAEFSAGGISRVVLSDDGRSVVAISRIHPHKFDTAVDVAVAPDGTIYVAQVHLAQISYLAPVAKREAK